MLNTNMITACPVCYTPVTLNQAVCLKCAHELTATNIVECSKEERVKKRIAYLHENEIEKIELESTSMVKTRYDKGYFVKGVVEQLCLNNAYQNTVMSDNKRIAKGVAAVGAAAMGEAVASTVLATGDTGYDVDYFTCVVEGKQLEGAFYKVEFSNGDMIEFAVEEIEKNKYAVLAARDSSKRILWMPLHQFRGTKAYKKHAIKTNFIYSVLFALFFLFCGYLSVGLMSADKVIQMGWIGFGVLFIGIIIVRVQFYKFSVAATEAFRILGYENPEWVDVDKVSREITKAMDKKERAETGRFAPNLTTWSYRY